MNYYDKLKRLGSVAGVNYWSHRVCAELEYLACLSSTKGEIYNARIEAALDYLMAMLDENHSIIKADALYVEELLSDLSAEAKKITVYCISHAHIDMNWMWGYQETVSVTVDTFRTILDMMKEYPDFTFGQSQASTYKIIEKHAPEMIEEIKKYVHEGRWAVTASTWVETDKNMPNGESLSRHILYTKRYLSKLLDIDPATLNLDFEPDTFGHNANVPEICQNGGVDYYYHCRGFDGPKDIYRWKSKSGKEVLVHRDPKWYNGDIDIRSFTDVPLFCQKNGDIDTYLRVYGVGDHGGGPTRRDIERIIDDASFPLYPNIKFGTYAQYFADLEKYRDRFPLVDHELNFVFTGCYTTQTRVKLSNRVSEDRAYESEFLSAAANALTGASEKTKLYGEAWENILFNHFHDILPGSGVIETREYALGKFQETLAFLNTNANTAMRNISDAIDTSAIPFEDDNFANAEGGGVGFAVSHESGHRFPQTERGRGKVRAVTLFNSTIYDRCEPVEITLWDYNYDLGLVYVADSAGNEVPFMFTATGAGYWGHSFTKLVIDANIPSLGYSTYIVKQRQYNGIGCVGSAGIDQRADYFTDDNYILENEKISASFDPRTLAIVSLTDKSTGEKIVTPDKPSALFRYIEENPRFGMTAWRVGPYMKTEILNSTDRDVRVTDYRHMPLGKYLSYEIKFCSSTLNVRVSLANKAKYLAFDIDCDWHEIGKPGNFIPQLNFVAPFAYTAQSYKYDIPFGIIERPAMKQDVPGNSFIRAESGSKHSLFIVTDSKYGFRGCDDSAAVTLIRGSYDPDPYPELGRHHIKLGVGLCCNKCQKQVATEFCHPISFTAATKHTGTLALDGQAAKLDCARDEIMLSSVKNAEDGGYILRFADYGGKGGHVKLELPAAPSRAALVDINEKKVMGDCSLDGKTVEFDVAPDSIATLLLK